MRGEDFFSRWPNSQSLRETVSWRQISRSDDDYFEPEYPSEIITRRTAFTRGTAWFPNDREFPALIRVSQDRVVGVTVYEDDEIWVIRESIYHIEWEQPKSDLM
jgi:hypothetical protein